MNYLTKLSFICLSFLFCNTAYSQLMNHGDRDFAQLNLYAKYIDESNNVMGMIHSALSDEEKKTALQENFDITLYHMPQLTLIDRFTCELAHASIKSNSRRMEGEIHVTMYNDLKELRVVEAELNDLFLVKTDKLKNFDGITADELVPMFKKIIEKQQPIIEQLNTLNSDYKTPKFYNDVNEIYVAFTTLLNSKSEDNSEIIGNINQLIEGFDFSPIEEWSYPKGMLVDSFKQMKSSGNIDLSPNDIYKADGIPQTLNKVLLIYKNNNKEEKFIELMNPTVILE